VFEADGGTAQLTRDVDEVAGLSAESKKSSFLGDGAGEDDVGDCERRLGKIAAGEWQMMGVGESEKAVEKPVEPRIELCRAWPDCPLGLRASLITCTPPRASWFWRLD